MNQPIQTFSGTTPVTANPFAGLPDLIQKILVHEENTDANIEIQEKHALSGEQGNAMMKIIREVILKTLAPQDLVSALQSQLHLDSNTATSMARDLLALRFLPMEWYIGPVQPILHQLGGDVDAALERAAKIYPEVYAPAQPVEGDQPLLAPSAPEDTYHLLNEFDTWIETPKGKAEILLRLTNLSIRVENASRDGRIPEAEGQKLLGDLDAVSYAINTQDLSSFETHTLRRQVEKFLTAIEGRA